MPCDSGCSQARRRQAGQGDHRQRAGETRDRRRGFFEADRTAGTLVHHDRGDAQLAAMQHVEAGQRVADGAEIAARHQDQRDAQRRHPVEHGVAIIERHHDAADAFDEHDIDLAESIARRENATTASKSSVRPSRRAAASGDERRRESKRRDAIDFGRRDRAAERREQDAWIARGGGGRVEPADHRLERRDASGRPRENAGSGRRSRRSCRLRCRSP